MTPSSTQLTNSNKRIYQFAQILVVAGFVAVTLFVADKIIFPTTPLTFDFANPNAQKNTITLAQFDSSNQPQLHGAALGIFDAATITLDTTAPITTLSKVQPQTAQIQKGYQSIFLPISNLAMPTTNQFIAQTFTRQLPSGTLLHYGNGIGIITDTQIISPIDDPQTITALGYSFDNLRKKKPTKSSNIDLSQYKKGKIFTLRSRHPNGTIIFFDDINRHYLIINNHLQPLSATQFAQIKQLTTQSQNFLPLITAQFANRQKQSTCNLRKSILPWNQNQVTCQLDITNQTNQNGDNYLLTTSLSKNQLQTAQITLTRARTISNARATLALIKKRLLQQYE